MAQTPNSATTPYITAEQFFLCYTRHLVADLLKNSPDDPPPSYSAMIDSTNPAGAKLLYHLKNGAGEIEAACAVAKRYTPEDLQALTGVSQVLLQKLNAARAFWSMSQILRPLTARPDDVPMAKESAQLLEELRDGVKIFTFEESQEAGLPSVVQANPNKLLTPNVITRVKRLFPNTYLTRLDGGSDG